jgi:aryl-alcohol dehydrogenase-like predicted oxidoreductase
MRYTMFGKTGLRVSELALGTMTFGDDWGWGAARDACARMLDLYEEAGGNFVDTANNYGERWRDVDDRRFTVRRAPTDDPELLPR